MDPLRFEILTEWDLEKRKNKRWHCWSFISKGFVPVLKQVQYFCLPFLQSSLNFGVDFCFSSNFYLLICLFDCFSFEGSQCRDLGGNWLTTVCLYCNCNFSYRKLHPPSSVIVHHPIQTKIKMHKNENKKWLTHPNSTHRPIKTQIKIHKNKDKKWLTNPNSAQHPTKWNTSQLLETHEIM